MPKRTGKSKGGDYTVGYGRPPAHGRFQKGVSGNPKGRAKGSKNLNSLLEAELAQLVPVTEAGRRRSISKGAAMIKQLLNKAMAGDARSSALILHYVRSAEAETERLGPASTFGSDDADMAVIAEILKLRERADGDGV